MTLPVFVAPEAAALQSCTRGDSYTLDGDEGFHAATVRRMDVGQMLDVVDGDGLRVRGSVIERAKKSLTLRVEEIIHEAPPSVRLILVQALSTGGRDEMAIEMATEVGVDAVIPWQAHRSEVRWKGEKAAKGMRKWESTLKAAAKQSRRAFIPRLEDACTSQRLAQWMSEETAAGAWVIVCHESTQAPLSLLLRELRAAADKSLPTTDKASGQALPRMCFPPRISVVVGPEGGIDPDELSLFEAAGARVCLLGTTVLRASTAGPVALSLISDAIGRW